jgi:hypothetical protein
MPQLRLIWLVWSKSERSFYRLQIIYKRLFFNKLRICPSRCLRQKQSKSGT